MKSNCRLLSLFLFSPHWRPPLHLSAPTLSATTKKPASLAGFRFLILSISRLTLFSFPRPLFPARLAPFSCLFKLQVVSNPA